MKIGIITCAFNEAEFIGPCIKQFDGFNFPHLILVSSKPWHGEWVQDNTWALAKMFLENGEVIIDHWKNQAEQLNYGLDILESEDYDWALIVDADEFYTSYDIGRIVGQIRNTKAEIIKANSMTVYWKDMGNRIIPVQNDSPVIAIKTNRRFEDKRKPFISGNELQELFIGEMHHLSYVRNDAQMGKKITTFEHSNEFDRDKWYNDVWLKWQPDMLNLHPVVPEQFKQAIYHPAPPEIRRYFD